MLNTKEEADTRESEYERQQKVMYCSAEEDNQVRSENLKFFYMIIQGITKAILHWTFICYHKIF